MVNVNVLLNWDLFLKSFSEGEFKIRTSEEYNVHIRTYTHAPTLETWHTLRASCQEVLQPAQCNNSGREKVSIPGLKANSFALTLSEISLIINNPLSHLPLNLHPHGPPSSNPFKTTNQPKNDIPLLTPTLFISSYSWAKFLQTQHSSL